MSYTTAFWTPIPISSPIAKACATTNGSRVVRHVPYHRSPEERGDEDGGDVVPGRDRCRFEPEKHVPRYPSTKPNQHAFEEHPEKRYTPQPRHMGTEGSGDDHRAHVQPGGQLVSGRRGDVHQTPTEPRRRSSSAVAGRLGRVMTPI